MRSLPVRTDALDATQNVCTTGLPFHKILKNVSGVQILQEVHKTTTRTLTCNGAPVAFYSLGYRYRWTRPESKVHLGH